MAVMTIDDLRRILVACAGETDADLGGDFSDETFEDLGYDSLALIETTSRIEREFGVRIDAEEIADLTTARVLLARVNQPVLQAG